MVPRRRYDAALTPGAWAAAAQTRAPGIAADLRASGTRAAGKRLSLSAGQGGRDAPRHPRHTPSGAADLSGDADAARHDRRPDEGKTPGEKIKPKIVIPAILLRCSAA